MTQPRQLTARERAKRDALIPANLQAAKRGDERAFMALYFWRAEQVAACAASGLPPAEVRHAVQQVFREAWHALPRCPATDALEFDVWLSREATRVILERRVANEEAIEPDSHVWSLPAALREVVFLRDAFGHGLAQVARAIAQPEQTVRLWYRNGLEALAA